MSKSNRNKIRIIQWAKRIFACNHNKQQTSSLPTCEIQFSNRILLPEIVKLLREGHTVTLRLRGQSMRPFLEDNRDKALLTNPSNLTIGDPVLAEISPKHYVLHRIVAIQDDQITLRGDGNLGNEYADGII